MSWRQVSRAAVVVSILLAGCTAQAKPAADPRLPDPGRTPGAINPDVTQENISSTICRKGFTKTVRPDYAWSNKLKHTLLRAAGQPASRVHDFELDHLVPLELGGAPYDLRNLWLEPWKGQWGAARKDEVEHALNALVCRHRLTLAQAQYAIASNWMQAYQAYVSR